MSKHSSDLLSKDLLHSKLNKYRWLGMTIIMKYGHHRNRDFFNKTGITKLEVIRFRLIYLGIIISSYVFLFFLPKNTLSLLMAVFILPIIHFVITPALIVVLLGYSNRRDCEEYINSESFKLTWL
jgi:hypothetical protein